MLKYLELSKIFKNTLHFEIPLPVLSQIHLRIFILELLKGVNNFYHIKHHFFIVFTSSLQCLIMSNDFRAENRRHRRNERNQAKRNKINQRQNERNQPNRDEINRRKNERNQPRQDEMNHRRNERNQAIREEINRRQNQRNQARPEHIRHGAKKFLNETHFFAAIQERLR